MVKEIKKFLDGLNPTKKMSEICQVEESTSQSQTKTFKKNMHYQYIKGENYGDLVEVESEDEDFLYFTNNTRIRKNVVGEFLAVVTNPDDAFIVERFDNIPITTPQQNRQNVVANNQKSNDNWMDGLLHRQKSKEIEMVIKIKMPSRDVLYEMAEDSEDSTVFLQDAIKMIVDYNTNKTDFLNDMKLQISDNVTRYYEQRI